MKQVQLSTRSKRYVTLVKAPKDDDLLSFPILLAASLDLSGSMATNTGEMKDGINQTRWQIVVGCLGQAIEYRRNKGHPDDLLLVVTFNEKATLVFEPVKLSDWKEEHFTQLMKLYPTGYTNISCGDVLLASEIQKCLQQKKTKPIIVTLNLTDGVANTGLIRSKDIAIAKREQIQVLVDGGYLTVNGFFAIGDCADTDVSRKCAKIVGTSTSLWKHVKGNDFMEFSGEMGLLMSLSQLVTSIKFSDQAEIVLKDTWCIIITEEEQGTIHLPILGSLILKCLQKKFDDFPVNTMMLECFIECLIDGGEKEEKQEEMFSSISSHDILCECKRFCNIVTQLYGVNECDMVILALVSAINAYKNNLEMISTGDTGMLRQFSSSSDIVCATMDSFEETYSKCYKRNTVAPVDCPPMVPLRRSPAMSFTTIPESPQKKHRFN
jgi:hypothetical protein